MVYTAEHPALAALEMLTAWDVYADFSRYHLYRCNIVDDAVHDAVLDVKAAVVDPRDTQATQQYGDAWIRARRSVALRVPSVVSVASYAYLVDPDHPEFEQATRRENLGPYRFDERLLELLARAKDDAHEDA